VPAGIVLLAVAVWLAAGIKRLDDPGTAAVLDSRLGLVAPRGVEAGWHLVPPGLLRLTLYPVRSATLAYESSSGGDPLVTHEGSAVDVGLTVRYRVDPERVLDVHRGLGPGFETATLPVWMRDALGDALGEERYADVSGARLDVLQTELSRRLTDRFRQSGLVLLSCDVTSVRLRPGAEPVAIHVLATGRVLLVGLDGADWNIIDPLIAAGRMPHLAALIRTGVRARMKTITPMLSPVVWTSMATGVVPARHGILDFMATTETEGERVPVTSTQRRVKALWTILSDNGVRVGIVGWWATWPAEAVHGFIVSDRVAQQIFGAASATRGERAGKVHPAEADATVMAETVAPESITPADLAPFMRLPADATELPAFQSKLIDDFKTLYASGRTYVGSAVALAARYRPDFLAVYIEGTDTVGHLFMPYAPPPLSGVDAEAQQRFARVVDAYYAHADGLLGRLLDAYAPSTVIVASDHGFRTGENRPLTESRIGYGAAADWHRKYGILVLNGPAFRHGVTLDEASVLDLTPTVLRLFGLPTGEDMDGRPISEAFDPGWVAAHTEQYVPTWEASGDRPPAVSPGPAAAGPASSGLASAGAPRAESPGTPEPGTAGASGAATGSPDEAGDRDRLQKLRDLGYIGGGEGGSPSSKRAPGVVGVETANTHNNRGTILYGEGRWDEAIREFEQAIAANEDLVIARLNIARAYYRKKDYARSEAILREHLLHQPRSKEAENLLGGLAMDQGRLEEAEAHFRKALSYEPNFTDARNSLGLLFEKLGRHDEALAEFQRVVKVDPEYAEGYNNIGVVLKNAGRIDEALSEFRHAIAADPDFAGAYSNIGLILEDRHDDAAAEEQFRNAVRRNPRGAAERDNLGGLLIRMGRLDEARSELEKAIALDPGYASARNNLGAVMGRLGNPEEEIACYRKAIALDPSSADAHHNLGLALLNSGSGEEGVQEMKEALAVRPNYVPAYLNLGRYLVDHDQARDATSLLQTAVARLPKDPEVRLLFGEALLVSGRSQEGEAALDEALKLKPGDESFQVKVNEVRRKAKESAATSQD
jgi:Tfp pilus assembly protein PilF/arylsulfatase A-like enzyme